MQTTRPRPSLYAICSTAWLQFVGTNGSMSAVTAIAKTRRLIFGAAASACWTAAIVIGGHVARALASPLAASDDKILTDWIQCVARDVFFSMASPTKAP